jgi:replicative DNA helicase
MAIMPDDQRHENGSGAGLPPHNDEAEVGVLGTVLMTESALDGIFVDLRLAPEDFYRPRHQLIFATMLRLKEKAEPEAIDAITVCDELKRESRLDEAGGQEYIRSLPTMVLAMDSVRDYARIVRDHAMLRRLLGAAHEIQQKVVTDATDPRSLVEQAEQAIFEAGHHSQASQVRSIHDVLEEELEKLERLSKEGTSLTGTASGFRDLDEITGGFQPGNLIVLAARPAMGKCTRGSALVYDPSTGARRRMDEVVAAIEAGEDVWVASLGPGLKLRTAKAGAAVRNGRKQVYRVTTRLGRRIEATANHPLLTLGGWAQIRNLDVGARIAVPRNLPRRGAPTSMPDHELVLLAALIADGAPTHSTPCFCFGPNSPVVEEVKAACTPMGVRLARETPGTVAISAGRGSGPNPVKQLCERHGIWHKGSATKFVPDAIFGLSDKQIARFLSVLYGCDGHVYVSERLGQIGYTTISERLARDVQHLLLRLGIVSVIRTLRREVYEGTDTVAREVRITGQDGLRRFCELVPVCGKREAWIDVLDAKGDRSWREISAASGRPLSHNWHFGTRGLSRGLTAEVAVATDSRVLAELADSDLWWDEVASIEPIGVEETYDIEVPVDHCFVADDVLVHNSALAANVAENAAVDFDKTVALFSLEMSEGELAQRFIASRGKINGESLRKGRVKPDQWPKLLKATEKLSRAPLYVDDSSDIGVAELRAKARRLHQREPLDLIIIDYLQLMRAEDPRDGRVEQVGKMSRGLKILARELNVPVIAISQLSRAVESRPDKRPLMSDLRECVTGDTLVMLADGRRVAIRDIVGTTPTVLSVDELGNVGPAVSDLVWPVGRRPVLELKLASGRSLRGTTDHRLRSGDGWTALGDLDKGDRVALARRLPEPPNADPWPESHVILLGQLIGDGSYLKGQPLRYTTASEENSEAVRRAAEDGFGARVSRYDSDRSWHQLVIAGNGTRWQPQGVGGWLKELGIHNQRSREKRVPEPAFRLPTRQIATLVRHLWATDGTMWVGASGGGKTIARVAYATINPLLAQDVAALLLRLGIVARIAAAPKAGASTTFHVVVTGAEQQRAFLDQVGAFGPRGPQAASLAAHLEGVRAATNVDTLPESAFQQVQRTMVAQGITQREMAALRGTSYGGSSHFSFAPSRGTLAGYAELLNDEDLRAMATDDLFWDRVVDVVPAGEEEVYDLTVPGPSCWLADGIVSHNSGNIEQDADLVMFVYRDEYYNKENSEKPGIAEVIIGKHRNGPVGHVELVFLDRYPKFQTKAPDHVGGAGEVGAP